MQSALLTLVLTTVAAQTTLPITRRTRGSVVTHDSRVKHLKAKLNNLVGLDEFSTVSNSPLLNKNNALYTCSISVGNGQVVELDLDTGSSDFWVLVF